MGTYEESGGEQDDDQIDGTPNRKRRRMRRIKHKKRGRNKKLSGKKRGYDSGNSNSKKRRKLNGECKRRRCYSNDSDFGISSNEYETSTDDDDIDIANNSMADSIKKLNEIMNDCPQQNVNIEEKS